MTFLLHLLAALAVVAAAELQEPAALSGSGLGIGLAATGLGLLVPFLVAAAGRAAALSGRFRLGRWFGLLLELTGVGTFALVTWVGWSAFAFEVGGEGATVLGWPGPGLVLLLAPFGLLEVAAILARSRLLEPSGPRRRAYQIFQIRMLAASATPLALYVAISSLIALSRPLRVHLEEVALLGTAFVALVLGLFAVFLPSLLRRIWDTVPLPDGPLREYLSDLARRGRFRFGELLLWRTGGAVANAAIVGFTPGQRVVLMTDGLLGQLDPRELRAVFGHEMGHSARRHVLVFAVWTLTVFVGLDLALTVVPPETDLQAALAMLAAAVFWFTTFGFLSRRAELEADLFALELTGEPDDLVRALDRVGGGPSRWRDGWRHFSIANRVLFLRAAAADPGVGRRLRRGLRVWSMSAAVVLVFLGLGWGAIRWGEIPAQRAMAELRLGRYQAAEEHAAAAGDGHADLLALANRGAALARDGAPIGPGPLLDRAGVALDRGDRDGAEALAWLAALRGADEALAVLRALRSGGEPTDPHLDALPEGWRTRLSAGPAESGALRDPASVEQ